jgi:hypothetical protein
MTMPASIDTVVITEGASTQPQHAYVDWPAIIAGILLASAVSLVMLSFGSAIGLSFANFHGGTGVSPLWIGIAAVSWFLWVEISSMLAGGYLAGRMRRRIHDATEHESDVRDGAHGILVWAGALLLGAIVAATGVGAASSMVGNIVGTATNAAASAAGPAAGNAAANSAFNPSAYFTDALFRPAAPAANSAPAAGATPAGGTAAPAATTAPAGNAAAPTPANRADAVAEAGRVLAYGAVNGSVSDDDKTYLAQLVAKNTGLSQADAKARVDQVLSNIDAAKKKAADAAETARKTAVLGAFLIAASLLVAGAAAYWAAGLGGRHRDEQTVFADFFRRF